MNKKIKIIMDDGHYYTEKQYRKDLMRMFNALKNDERFAGKENCDPFDCEECPCIWERNNDLKNAIKSLREENEELKERIREYALGGMKMKKKHYIHITEGIRHHINTQIDFAEFKVYLTHLDYGDYFTILFDDKEHYTFGTNLFTKYVNDEKTKYSNNEKKDLKETIRKCIYDQVILYTDTEFHLDLTYLAYSIASEFGLGHYEFSNFTFISDAPLEKLKQVPFLSY